MPITLLILLLLFNNDDDCIPDNCVQIKKMLRLKIPNIKDDFILYTDASERGMGAVLFQI